MKKLAYLPLVLALLAGCRQDQPQQTDASTPGEKHGLSLSTEANPEWQYENLRLYPILADDATVEAQSSLAAIKTLADAMGERGFRVMERKQFGRQEGAWYNALTVQNKTGQPVFLMSGDVVTGGNQDRVIAQDQVIAGVDVKNIEVFCVEAGRSTYYDPQASVSEKEVAAFKGYYSVASPQVRQAVQRTGNQSEVWAAVANVTKANGAESTTSAYAALDRTESDQKAKRDAYIRFFDGKLTELPNAVGVVAVCGDKVLAVDIFGHPQLFRSQFPNLLHGYAAEAAVLPAAGPAAEAPVERDFLLVSRLAAPGAKSHDKAGKFSYEGKWLHLFMK